MESGPEFHLAEDAAAVPQPQQHQYHKEYASVPLLEREGPRQLGWQRELNASRLAFYAPPVKLVICAWLALESEANNGHAALGHRDDPG